MHVVAIPKTPQGGEAPGIPGGKVDQMILSGWTCIPGVTIQTGSAIVVPGQTAQPWGEFDLWIPPPAPMIPVGFVMEALVQTAEGGQDIFTLDALCRLLFNRRFKEVETIVLSSRSPQEGSDRPPDIRPVADKGNGSK